MYLQMCEWVAEKETGNYARTLKDPKADGSALYLPK